MIIAQDVMILRMFRPSHQPFLRKFQRQVHNIINHALNAMQMMSAVNAIWINQPDHSIIKQVQAGH